MVSPNASPIMDTSLAGWVYNIRQTLHFPITILSVAGLLVAGAFAETAPRKSLLFLDNYIGRAVFFVLPLICALVLDWPTGLLAAAVSLIVFARLQIRDSDENSEGFEDKVLVVSNPKRWLIETVLGETPIAITSDRIKRVTYEDEDARTSSSSAMTSTGTSDGSSHK
jgi:hypothetical protein